MKRFIVALVLLLVMTMSYTGFAEEHKKDSKKSFKVPDSVLNISKENTYTNPTQDLPYLQPSTLAEELLKSTDISIENPDLIRILNESTISSHRLMLGFRASIYLGEWPLSYQSQGTDVNWQYKKVNTNYIDNRGGRSPQKLTYTQEQQKKISGGLTANIPNSEAVKKMMMNKAAEVTNLPLAFESVIGQGTKKDHTYNIPPNQIGYLTGFVPAVNEKGKVTYGEVYLTFKGGKHKLEVKNVTQQGISAWIPVQDHIMFSFRVSNQP